MSKFVNFLLSIFISFKIIFNTELDYIIYFGDSNYYMSTSAISDNGDLIITSSKIGSQNINYFFGIKSNGKPYFDNNYTKIFSLNESIERWESNAIFIGNNSFLTFSIKSIEVFNFKSNFFKSFTPQEFLKESFTSKRNSIIKVNDNSNNYIFCYVNNNNFTLKKFELSDENLNNLTEKQFFSMEILNQTIMISCFLTDDSYVICLYKSILKKNQIAIFDIDLNLKNISDINCATQDYIDELLYAECIHLKKNVGAFAFFPSYHSNNIIFLLWKLSDDKSQMENYIEDIDQIILNQNTQYNIIIPRFNRHSLIKLSEKRIAFISGGEDDSFIIIILLELFNDDQNVFVKYYHIDILKTLGKYFYDSLRGMNYNGLLSLGIALKNDTNENSPCSQAFIFFGYYSLSLPEIYNVSFMDFYFPFNFSEMLNDEEIINNIFNYHIYKIKFLEVPSPDETNIEFRSSKNNSQIKINDSVDVDDFLILKKVSNNKEIKLGMYHIISVPIIKESDFNKSMRRVNYSETYGNNSVDFNNYYIPQEYYGKIIDSYIFVNETGCDNYISANLSECKDEIEEGTFYEENEYKRLGICDERCKTCNGSSIDNCTSFKEDYHILDSQTNFEEENTVQIVNNTSICNNLYYITNINNEIHFNCISLDKCDDDHPYLNINNQLECKICNDISKERIIFNYCASSFDNILQEKFNELRYDDEDKEAIEYLTKDKNTLIHLYKASSDAKILSEKNNLIYVDLGDNIKDLLRDSSNSISRNNIFLIVYENYNIEEINFFFEIYSNSSKSFVNLSLIKNSEITVYNPIKNLDQYNYNLAEIFSEQGYDIYNASSSFYIDICSTAYIEGNDLVIKDRKFYIYPSNSTICFEDCEYAGINLTTKNFICKCKISNYYKGKNFYFENTEDYDNFFSYILDDLNYKIIKCFNLISNIKNFYYNIGFYISSCFIIFNFISLIIFYMLSIKKLRILFYKDIPKENGLELNQKRSINSPVKKQSIGNSTSIMSDKEGKGNNDDKNDENNVQKIILLKHDSNSHLIYPSKSKKKIVKKKKNKVYTNNIKKYSSFYNNDLVDSNNIINDIKSHLPPESKDDIMNLTFTHLSSVRKKVDKNELNDLPYSTALVLDKRDAINTFINILFLRIEIIKIFFFHEEYSSLIIDLNHFLFSVLFEIFMNALLFSDDIISQKYHSNGELDKITILFLSFTSMIISKIFDLIINKLIDYDLYISILIKDVKKEAFYLYYVDKIIKYMKIKIAFYFTFNIIISFFIIYYLFLFCSIYFNAQIHFIINFIYGIFESLVLSIIISLLVCILRKFGLLNKNKIIYNTSKYINRYM